MQCDILDVRTAVLNERFEDAFRYRYPGFRSAKMIKLDQRLCDAPRILHALSAGQGSISSECA
jgi:hypothetical protein